MPHHDTKGDLYECILGKIASAEQNGQFRTPRYILLREGNATLLEIRSTSP